ncbi:3-oxoacid CoA-transferase subunit A [Rhodalgimonas zhirmunskyi]|uniref:3-oxoacid CoA-transferase subunit A n=1 Tax=Rhodalgimonas zhirmunskyi TaxID=2964767 RepID=A0AAJ1U5Z4_9RHOB|nr:3-oxoacid CoA-transferase subunit A [Rhodoalgimonas zhirmunskyi]MDQ2093644.1 3-oxoacid CoA-transferase subunit A [Rhodoalgimonas zhirmunskyi]
MDKTCKTVAEAVAGIADGASVMIAGFGGSGAPVELIHALIDAGPRHLTVINNNAGTGQVGLAAMIREGMVDKVICSYPRTRDAVCFNEAYAAGKLELEVVPQGTLAERIRAGGAGIPAFYTPTGVGTELAEGKAVGRFEGKDYVQERWLKADVALIKGEVGDPMGNLTYRMSARNFNPIMAMAATRTIAQVRRMVAPGGIPPEDVITPGIFVDALVEVPDARQEEDLIRAEAVYP